MAVCLSLSHLCSGLELGDCLLPLPDSVDTPSHNLKIITLEVEVESTFVSIPLSKQD